MHEREEVRRGDRSLQLWLLPTQERGQVGEGMWLGVT